MKIAKLFKKLKNFLEMDEKAQSEESKKKEKLESSLSEKIASMKEKIRDSDNNQKKQSMIEELEMLIKLSEELQKTTKNHID